MYISYIGTSKAPQRNDRESSEKDHNYSAKNRHCRYQVLASSDEEETSENTLPTKKTRQSEKSK